MAQTSMPESTRNLPNFDLKPRHKNFGALAAFDLRGSSGFKEQRNRFL
jgi:hypothetical protein